ncbi:glycosyl hydrolase [Fontibacillus sp. BL9]|uniref:glycosyl hydrolase n=1 Tax=Fontibacillus sp. BL9 TaxID=3389971 RepID=UPI00397E42C6
MNSVKRKGTAALLAALLCMQLAVPAGSIQAAESSQGKAQTIAVQSGVHWAQSSIDQWMSSGVVKGYPDGSFHPDEKVTRAELATIINRMFGFSVKSDVPFTDVPAGAWYGESMAIARAAGYYEGLPGNLSKATANVSRQDAVTLITKALSLKNESAVNLSSYKDESEISAYAREAIAAIAGYVSGYPDGTFRPNQPMTRAELVTVLDHLVSQYVHNPGTVSGGEVASHVMINQSGVTLKDSNISGNLYLTPGIGDGDAELNRVTVKGTTFVSGGGDQSIHIVDSNLSKLIANRIGGKVRTVLSGTTTLGQASLNTAAILELGNGTAVSSLTIGSRAAGSVLEGQGSVAEITVLADNVKINGQTAEMNKQYALKNGKLQDVAQAGTTPAPGSNGSGNSSSGTGSGSGSTGGSGTDPGTPAAKTVNLVDDQATAETKSLYAFLNETRGKQVLFGHQHDTTVSFAGKDDQGKVISDVYHSVGDYPVVFGWDTLSLDGLENPPGVAGDYEASRLSLSKAMKEAYELGGIVTLSTHPYNPVTGGDFKDTSNTEGATQSVVTRILPGGDANGKFREYLDRIAAFANQLKDDNGKPIPVLFRPFHEQNGSWFWWGSATTTKSEYVEFYRYTVEYLRDVKHVSNFLYVYSPNGPFNGNQNEYLTTYPGDEFVDILGMDQYDDKENAGSEGFLNGLVKDLAMISKLADSRGKVATLSEYGYSAAGMKTTGNNELNWFTKISNAIKSHPDAKRIAYMLTWANFGEGNNLFVPYKDIPGKGSHELLPDFIQFYNDPYTYFSMDVKGANIYKRTVIAASEKPFLHIVTPTNVGTVSEAPAVIRAKVLNAIPSKVTYSIGTNGPEIEMKLDADGYYSADWLPEAALNGNSAEITVRAYLTDSAKLEQTVSVFVKVRELTIKQFTFDTADSLDAVQNNGTWPSTIAMELAHGVLDGDGKLEFKVSGLTASESWQELKLQLTSTALADVDLAQVKRLKLSALVPVSLAGPGSAIQAIAMYPEDGGKHKYGMDATKKTLSDLEQVTIAGKAYYKYDAVIELDNADAAAKASGLAVSLVGSALQQNGSESIFLDDLGLFSAYTAPILDSALVDDYEAYGGSDDALAAKYPKAGGDDVSVSLTTEHKLSGEYGMKLQYNIDSAGYTGVGKNLGTVDWSDTNALHLWVATGVTGAYAKEGKPLKLVIQVHMNNTAYEAYPELDLSTENELSIPFSDFEVASWSSGGPVSKEGLEKVTDFKIYVNSMDQGKHSGVLYFDDIRAVKDDSLPEIPDNGQEPAGTPPGVLYKFESVSDVDGWNLSGNTAKALAPVFDQAEGALSVEFPLVNTGKNAQGISNEEFEVSKPPSGLNLKGLDSITVRVKLSEGTAKARIFMKSGSGWTWSDSGSPVPVDSSGYTTLSISLPEAAKGAGVDLKDIKVIGIKVEEIGNDGGTAKLYLNDVALNKAEPQLVFGFEKDTEGWAKDSGNVTVTQDVYSENGQDWNVLKNELTWQADGEFIAVGKMAATDFSPYDGIEAKVKIVSDIPGVQAKLFIKLRNYAIWIDSGALSADGEGFTTLRIDFSNMNPYIGNSTEPPFTREDLKAGNAIGIQFVTPDGSAGNATVYIDEVRGYKN